MQDLIKQEQFELEILDKLNTSKMLNYVIFGGGTMLRLCFGLNRFSVDLDFWLAKQVDEKELLNDLKDYLTVDYTIKDYANKFNTILFEISSVDYPRNLKIEIRKKVQMATEQAIAYSPHSNKQVLVNIIPLKEMMKTKIEAFLNRKEIRDVFDMEFLLKKGIRLPEEKDILERVLKEIDLLSKKDYSVKLGSLLEARQRNYYKDNNFRVLRLAIQEQLED
ncbi:nucleotidyl transferase AbiEii/AbiGii toxin family protein [Chlamydiota bacterium]